VNSLGTVGTVRPIDAEENSMIGSADVHDDVYATLIDNRQEILTSCELDLEGVDAARPQLALRRRFPA
jgi:hypothetical protein